MAKIIKNEAIGKDTYKMSLEGQFQGKSGQFYMVRGWDEYPLLSRPISIFDLEKDAMSFVYQVVGKGTEILAKKKAGENIELQGPYGNGFPKVSGKVALIGGGIGTAPLFFTGKNLKEEKLEVEAFLGFREEPLMENDWSELVDYLKIDIGGIITDHVEIEKYDAIFTCGPEAMMKAVVEKAKGTQVPVYVSVEKRMACGVGACLVCTCSTKSGNKKTCKDGPVFLGEEVYYD